MQIFSAKTLNCRCPPCPSLPKLNLSLSIANWYEDRLVRDQVYKTNPDLRIVSGHSQANPSNYYLPKNTTSLNLRVDQREGG